ncbi:MAG TPA: hypothetical protein DCS93_16860 [Microscillaceae bacterium]|nr:hypothetical protein [Microscillaceae bacterium]
MPRVKTITIDFGGEQHSAHINVNSQGMFSCKLPPHVSYGIGLSVNRLSGNTLAEVEGVLMKTYEQYLSEATLLEPVIRIAYRGNGHYNISGKFVASHFSFSQPVIMFDFEVLLKETLPSGQVNYYNTHQRENGEWQKNGRLVGHDFSASKFVPFSEQAFATLEQGKLVLQQVSRTLHDFLDRPDMEIEAALTKGRLLE